MLESKQPPEDVEVPPLTSPSPQVERRESPQVSRRASQQTVISEEPSPARRNSTEASKPQIPVAFLDLCPEMPEELFIELLDSEANHIAGKALPKEKERVIREDLFVVLLDFTANEVAVQTITKAQKKEQDRVNMPIMEKFDVLTI